MKHLPVFKGQVRIDYANQSHLHARSTITQYLTKVYNKWLGQAKDKRSITLKIPDH